MEKINLKEIIAQPGKTHKVSAFNPSYTGALQKKEAQKLLTENTERLSQLQDKLYAHDQYAVLLIFQAMDAAGKDGTIKHVMTGINPQGCQVYSFKQPSDEELDHDYLWRINKSLPERGRIGIFNRSHYEDVLVTKVHPEILLSGKHPGINSLKDINKNFWMKRYRQINDFERYLTENGIIVLKFFLNVSHEEQEKRFLARLNDESKNWKFSASDIKEREYWDDYMKVYSDMLTYTSTEVAPWHVIPANNKWFMRYVVGKILADKMESLKLHYPTLTQKAKDDIEAYKKILQTDINQLDGSEKKEKETQSDLQEQNQNKVISKKVSKKKSKK